MRKFAQYKPTLNRMSHDELFEFYKNYSLYIKNRTILKTPSGWSDSIKYSLDKMDHKELSDFNKNFKSYIQARLITH